MGAGGEAHEREGGSVKAEEVGVGLLGETTMMVRMAERSRDRPRAARPSPNRIVAVTLSLALCLFAAVKSSLRGSSGLGHNLLMPRFSRAPSVPMRMPGLSKSMLFRRPTLKKLAVCCRQGGDPKYQGNENSQADADEDQKLPASDREFHDDMTELDRVIMGDIDSRGDSKVPERSSGNERLYISEDFEWNDLRDNLFKIQIEASLRLLRLSVEDLCNENRALVETNQRLSQLLERQCELMADMNAALNDGGRSGGFSGAVQTSAHVEQLKKLQEENKRQMQSLKLRQDMIDSQILNLEARGNPAENLRTPESEDIPRFVEDSVETISSADKKDKKILWEYEMLLDDLKGAAHGPLLEKIVQDNLKKIDVAFMKWIATKEDEIEDERQKAIMSRLLGRVSLYRERALNNGMDPQDSYFEANKDLDGKSESPNPSRSSKAGGGKGYTSDSEPNMGMRLDNGASGSKKKTLASFQPRNTWIKNQVFPESIDSRKNPESNTPEPNAESIDEVSSLDQYRKSLSSELDELIFSGGALNAITGHEVAEKSRSDLPDFKNFPGAETLIEKVQVEREKFQTESRESAMKTVSPIFSTSFPQPSMPEKPIIKSRTDLSGYTPEVDRLAQTILTKLLETTSIDMRRNIFNEFVIPNVNNQTEHTKSGERIQPVHLEHKIQLEISKRTLKRDQESENYPELDLRALIEKKKDSNNLPKWLDENIENTESLNELYHIARELKDFLSESTVAAGQLPLGSKDDQRLDMNDLGVALD
mmetsp:Transcript_9293/g.22855  ORF Transcript_9293/g.22855 Transcript_9293/m.22855 type:complete len:764 (-) Transcript_9293:127-2418(-)